MTELTNTAAAILAVLRDGPFHGGQLVVEIGARYGSFFSASPGVVYRELLRLAEAGLIEAGEQGPRASQDYAITRRGRNQFRRWLGTSPGGVSVRSSTLLRLVYTQSMSGTDRDRLLAAARDTYMTQRATARDGKSVADSPEAQAIAQYQLDVANAALKLINAVPR